MTMNAKPQTIVGIVGGIGPESTIDYYRAIISEYAKHSGGTGAPAIVITSIDVQRALALLGAKRMTELTDYFATELERLHRAGADFAVLSANTPHIIFDDLRSRSPVPLLSIVEAVAERAKSLGLQRLGLLGTRFTMEAPFYPQVLERQGIVAVRPRPDEIALIHDRYINELLVGAFKPETKEELLAVARRLRDEDGIDGLVLGGTELPLILRDTVVDGVAFLDSTLIHVDAIVARLLA
jgi:aspartate racemase